MCHHGQNTLVKHMQSALYRDTDAKEVGLNVLLDRSLHFALTHSTVNLSNIAGRRKLSLSEN